MTARPRRLALLTAAVALVALASTASAAQRKAPAAAKKPARSAKPRDYAHTLAVIRTPQGDVTVKLFNDKAPNHVKSFVDLAASGFYDGTLFHRVIPGFVVQAGDPLTKDPARSALWGTGGATDPKGNPIELKPEFNDVTHRRGIVSMARGPKPDSASSQFFIVLKDSPFLDHEYTVFGEVVKGMDAIDKLVTDSNPDTTDQRTGGKPRSYQKIVKIDLVDETPAP